MNIDKFGHHIHKRMRLLDLIDFKDNALIRSEAGDYDLKSARLKGLKPPIDMGDAVNKKYVDYHNNASFEHFANIINKFQTEMTVYIKNNLESSLKAMSSELLPQLENFFYTKQEIDNKIKTIIPNDKTGSSK